MTPSQRLNAPVGTLIVNPAPTVRPDLSLTGVVHLMNETGSSLVIVTQDDVIIGAVKHQNVVAAVAAALDLDETTAAEAMTNVYIRLEAALPIIEAAAVMADDASPAVLVLDRGRPQGVVSMSDIIDHVASPRL